MGHFASVPEFLGWMETSFDPTALGGVRGVVRLDIAGSESGRYWLSVSETCASGTGDSAEPVTATIACNNEDFLSIVNGTAKPFPMFVQGRLKVSGDLARLMAAVRAYRPAN